jgi:putative ABC transport system permease protein
MNAEIKTNLLKPRWRKVFTDLWQDKTRTGLVVASIAVGVFAIGMVISTYVVISQDINLNYAAINPPNIIIRTDPFDKTLVDSIKGIPGVKDAVGRRLIQFRAKRGTEDWQSLTLIGLHDYTGNINLLSPIEGTRYPGDEEVLITKSLLNDTGYKVGDNIEIELPDGLKHNLKVVGLVTDQTAAKPDPGSGSEAFVTMQTLRSFGQDSTYNQLYITTADGTDMGTITGVAKIIKDQVKNSQRVIYQTENKLSNEHPMSSTILAVLGVLGALGVLITVLSSTLIVNTLNALLTEQQRQIGIMKLVGARSNQILGMYLTLIVAYGLISLLISIPLGAIAGYALALLIANLLGAVLQGFRVIPAAVITQTLIAILLPLGAGYFPVHRGAKTKIQEAISNYRPGSRTARQNLITLPSQWANRISRPILLSFRNTFRKKGRLLLTIFTLTVAGAVFIAVFNVRDSLDNMMGNLMQHFMGDITVDLYQPYDIPKVERTLLEIPGITAVEGWGGASGEIRDSNDKLVNRISIVAPPQDTRLLHQEIVAGRGLLPGEKSAIVVSDTIYKFYPDLKPGDSLLIRLPGRQTEKWKVVGIYQFVNMLGDPLAYANFDFLADEMSLPYQAASYRITTETHDIASQSVMVQRINNYLGDRNFPVQRVESGTLVRKQAAQAINILIIFLVIMAVLTAIVGSIGLTGTMSINVLERTREIGVMRTVGAVDRVIMQSVIFEGLVIGLITWLLAIVLSFPISFLLLRIVGEAMMGSVLALSFTPLGILVWLGVVLILSTVASILPARNAARLTINEVLAYE